MTGENVVSWQKSRLLLGQLCYAKFPESPSQNGTIYGKSGYSAESAKSTKSGAVT